MRERRALAVALMASSVILPIAAGCGATASDNTGSEPSETAAETPRSASCPEKVEARDPLPGVEPRHRTLAYWIERMGGGLDPDEVLLTPDEIAAHDRALEQPWEDQRPIGQTDLSAPIREDVLLAEVVERLELVHQRLSSGEYVERDGQRMSAGEVAAFAPVRALPELTPSFHVALAPVPVRCGPRVEGFYTPSLDLAFDRNNCSTARPQEIVQVLARWPNGMRLARTSYTLGFIADDAALSPRIPDAALDAMLSAPKLRARAELALRAAAGSARATIAAGTLLATAGGLDRVWFATREGVHESAPITGAQIAETTRPLTRRAVLEEAFAMLDAPYGWGDQAGGRDCSRYLLDVFGTFGLTMPRHSARQALAGTFSIDVRGVTSERERLLLVDAAAKKGIVLLHFPGHIMLYLGRTERGVPMVIHSFAEYVTPCAGENGPDGKPLETLHTVGRVTVSNLELGRGSSRTSFIERLTDIVVLGKPPGVELGGVARLRPAAPVVVPRADQCRDSTDAAVFRSPESPHTGQRLRVMVTMSKDPGPAQMLLVAPSGERVAPEVKRFGGPPYTFVADVERPAPGAWTAVVGDGERVIACERIRVHASAERAERERGPGAWAPRWQWERDTENLYSAFVESLFDYPPDEDLTWPNLQVLLQDRDRNLLFGHLGKDEESRLRLQPDCADLPYFLRAYFAWKMQLPFAFRQCSRGRAGQPPRCGPPRTNLEPQEATDTVGAFTSFIRSVASGVHSATARTAPTDDDTDVYPVPLEREHIPAGTTYADPYGHLLVVADWLPQGTDRYGVLLAADAQPDGTIGRRRFWRGTFLFTPQTTDAGAGFKAWRPVVIDRNAGTVEVLDNDALRRSRDHRPWSDRVYRGTTDDFYDRMEALINPRPLDARQMMRSLVDALEESVVRRIVSVDNGEQYMATSRGAITMPSGHDIFETTGAWEDYATPSRDMRLLIAIDAVVGFPDAMARRPEGFGLRAGAALDAEVSAVREELRAELARRTFEYRKSDGAPQRLTLADIVARAAALEVAYNPNDCVELRWGAPEGSPEMTTCRRRAPADQRAKMERYRAWFRDRQRPPR